MSYILNLNGELLFSKMVYTKLYVIVTSHIFMGSHSKFSWLTCFEINKIMFQT